MLEVSNLSVSYGRHRALEGVSVRIEKGEICVVLGANGAGKSTLLKAIAGMVRADPGSTVVMHGKPITALKPHRIVEEGIALVPEGRGIFGDLTVAENLRLGAFAARARADEAETLRRIYALFPRLAERKAQIARTMSGGEQQMVAIGRALMSKPDILMLDEPSLGLSPLLSQELFRALAEVAKTGVGILLVEQNAKQSLKIAERGYLIENGHVTGENTAKALMNDPAVVSAYLGGAAKTTSPAAAPQVLLPPSMRLPASLEAMSQAIGDFAGRAGRIQQAFVRALRRDGALPAAFVGRYDPKAAADPWAEIAEASPSQGQMRAATVSLDARKLSDDAVALATRASERLVAHVVASRLTAPRPSAFAASPKPQAESHQPQSALNGSHGLIGHNSAGLAIDDEGHVPPPVAGPSIADLVARAASIHAAHVAAQRGKRLTAYTIPARLSPKAGKPDTAGKKRKKHKEA